MNSINKADNEKDKEEIRSFVIVLLLRVVGIFVWFYIYASYMWFLSNENNTIQILVPTALIIGFITLLSPRKLFGVKNWRYVVSIYFILTFLLVFLR